MHLTLKLHSGLTRIQGNFKALPFLWFLRERLSLRRRGYVKKVCNLKCFNREFNSVNIAVLETFGLT